MLELASWPSVAEDAARSEGEHRQVVAFAESPGEVYLGGGTVRMPDGYVVRSSAAVSNDELRSAILLADDAATLARVAHARSLASLASMIDDDGAIANYRLTSAVARTSLRWRGWPPSCASQTFILWPGMMLKLYREARGKLEYWEAWKDKSKIIVHWGIVGDRGQTSQVAIRSGVDAETMIGDLARRPQGEGYSERPEGDLPRVVVQYSADRFNDFEDVEPVWDAVERLLNEELGWSGLGRCVAVDYSSELTFITRTVDPVMAAERIQALLASAQHAEGAVIAVERDDRYEAVWPASRAGSEVI